MLLTRDYLHEFDWRGKRLRVGFLLPGSRAKIAAGIELMSRETIRHRFFGIKNGFTERELKHLTEIDGTNHFALGLEEVAHPERGIAVIRMVRDDLRPNEAEIAVLIIDEYQKQGLGKLLMNLCLVAANERSIDTLRFTFLPDNLAIRNLIRFYGKAVHEALASDYVQQSIPVNAARVAEVKLELAEFLRSK